MTQDIPQSPSQGQAPDVSVLIVNYNGVSFLDECLATVRAAFSRYSYEIIVIDNLSTDGSREYLSSVGDIVYIESSKNLGFTGGNNAAAAVAKGKVLLLLNNDTRVDTKLDDLIDDALRPEIGAVGCRLVYGDGRQQASVGYLHTPLRIVLSWMGLGQISMLPSLFRRLETDPSYYLRPHSGVAWVSGACLATRRDIWQQLSGLDDRYFMYCEDVDYCLRAGNAGYAINYLSETRVTHYEGAGKAWIGERALLQTTNSYWLFVSTHYSRRKAVGTSIALGCVFLLRSLAFQLSSLLRVGVNGTTRSRRDAFRRAALALFRKPWTSPAGPAVAKHG